MPLPPSSVTARANKPPPGELRRVRGCRMADCNACKYCPDKPARSSGTLRRKCVLRVCENESNVAGNGLPLPDQAATVARGVAAAAAAMAAVQQARRRGQAVAAARQEDALWRVRRPPPSVDCNECKYCLDKPKLGGNNTLRRM